jgi:hypothetical protein
MGLANNDGTYRSILDNVTDPIVAENFIRPLVDLKAMGGMISLGIWGGTLSQYCSFLTGGTVNASWNMGSLMGQPGGGQLNNILAASRGTVLFQGYLLNNVMNTGGGFNYGTTVWSTGVNGAPQWYVQNLNENVMASQAGQAAPLAIGPDLICFFDLTDGVAFSNAEAADYSFTPPAGSSTPGPKFQHQVAVIRCPCSQQQLRPDILGYWQSLLQSKFFYFGPMTVGDKWVAPKPAKVQPAKDAAAASSHQ